MSEFWRSGIMLSGMVVSSCAPLQVVHSFRKNLYILLVLSSFSYSDALASQIEYLTMCDQNYRN